MSDFIQLVLAGAADGAIYGLLALALVLIYRSTHIVNFGQGEMAMFATYLAWSLLDAGVP
ncbi:MAG: branched-chain amino acid ABC transporter permease, partial [Dehalococcoidia bacterium]|nr:branched-chain amino acid ABC transporter permease [Dehalococcoidia bacterium]